MLQGSVFICTNLFIFFVIFTSFCLPPDSPKFIEPLRQNLRSSLGEILNPLPKIVADQMAAAVNDSKFGQYFASQIGGVIAPNLSAAYRDELRQVLVPAFSKGVDDLTKELDNIVRKALDQREYTQ